MNGKNQKEQADKKREKLVEEEEEEGTEKRIRVVREDPPSLRLKLKVPEGSNW